jgi:hypothetical protein
MSKFWQKKCSCSSFFEVIYQVWQVIY